jgi:hypothetical protein
MADARTTISAPGRLILGLMVFTMTFSLVGGELEKSGGGTPTVSPAKIIFGGTVATSLLTLVSHAGPEGQRFATGLATVAFITSALVYGKPVWDRLNEAFGTSPTTPVGSTSPTTPATVATPSSEAITTATALTAT